MAIENQLKPKELKKDINALIDLLDRFKIETIFKINEIFDLKSRIDENDDSGES